MRVIRTSNFDHEDWRGDRWFVTVSLTEDWANAIADALNKNEHDGSDNYFVVVEDSYILPPDWQP